MSTPASHSPTIDTSKTLEEEREDDTIIIMEEEDEAITNNDTSTTEPGPVVSSSDHFEEEEEEGVVNVDDREEGEILDDDDDINEATDRPSASDRGPTPPQLVLVPSPSRIHGDEAPTQEGNVGTPVKSLSPSTVVTESPPTSLPPLSSQPSIRSEETPDVAMETDPPPVSEVGGASSQAPPLSDQESSDDSDEEAIDLEIVIEGEEDEDEDVVVMERSSSIKAPPTSGSVTMTTTGPAPSGSQGQGEGGKRSKECAKVKQFFTTLQKFANNISHDVAEQVQELITALVVRNRRII